ncbi:hypothetical protein RUM44_005637 [Polyplax serrata]|uniref:Dynein axonemal assembly factor 1 homolog n=1 Tax=Polyplax serrata TaxID=468196 RepID=A0ABR1AED6_POLSC
MLSLQHNLISRTDEFSGLGINKLVFLDLYNNQVETIMGLESLENLRVLLFGKNRLKKIGGIRTLTKLEVLDLHGNQINQISGLNSLVQLKVLNLAGNQIRTINSNDLEGLRSLQELNLKRNRLRKVLDLAGPSHLEKLFLSNNEISSMDDVLGVCQAVSLKEVTIDGNPITLGNDCIHMLVSHLPNLQVLSHMQVTESVRRSAILWRKNWENLVKVIASEDCTSRDFATNRVSVISNAKNNWDILKRRTRCLPNTSSSLKDLRTIEECESTVSKTIQSDSVLSVASSMTLSSRDSLAKAKVNRKNFMTKRSRSEETPDNGEYQEPVEYFKLPPILASLTGEKSSPNSDSSEKSKVKSNFDSGNEVESSEVSEGTGDRVTDDSDDEESGNVDGREKAPNKQRAQSVTHPKRTGNRRERCLTGKAKSKFQGPGLGKVREQGGDYLIEICGRCLNVYGQGALRFVDRPWNPVKAGDVTTVRFTYVTFGGICNVLGKLKQRFPNAENFVFRETNITSLGQLNALADVQGLTALQIDPEGNPITEKNWRNYAIYRLAHWGLKKINGEYVTEEDIEKVAEEYQGLSDLVLWSLPESLLQPLLTRLRIEGTKTNQQQSAKQWLRNADPALRSVVCKEALQWRRGTQDDLYWRHKGKLHLGCIIDLTCAAIEKLRIFEARWPTILNQMIRDTLVDYSHMDSYMKKCLQEL